MKLHEQRVTISAPSSGRAPLAHLASEVSSIISGNEQIVRIAVTDSSPSSWTIELGTLHSDDSGIHDRWKSVFECRHRGPEDESAVNVALVVPTGIGEELGGHAGDAGAVARLLSSAADRVITHPNVVNASDINELPENGLYVEGSVLSRLLMGQVGLRHVRSNRLLTILDDHPDKDLIDHAINSVGAARATMGLKCPVTVRLRDGLRMRSEFSDSGRAVGEITGLEDVLEVADQHDDTCDAIAVTSRIQVPSSYHYEYYLGGLVNPWGGVEAMLTHTISTLTGKPSAHSPMMESEEILNLSLGVVDPRMAAEVVSVTYLHCILKGLHRAPNVLWNHTYIGRSDSIWAEDISALVIPEGCIGLPTLAAAYQGIPIIAVGSGTNLMHNCIKNIVGDQATVINANNYLEAAGIISAIRSGTSLESLQRPLKHTNVIPRLSEEKATEFGDVVRFRAS